MDVADPKAWARTLHDYTTGQPVDEQKWAPLIARVAAVDSRGVPQIVDPSMSHACKVRVNELAAVNPQWAKLVGPVGLVRVAVACVAEEGGFVPPGFTNAVIDELQVVAAPLWKRPLFWIVAAAAVAGGTVLLRRRRR